jgi:hypothetical protein
MRALFLFGIVLATCASCSVGAGAKAPSDTGAGGSGYDRVCSTDANCAQTQGCVAGTCVDRVGGGAGTTGAAGTIIDAGTSGAAGAAGSAMPSAVEIRAPGITVTEITDVPATWALQASATVAVSAGFATTATEFPSSANVLFAVPALIPGRPALIFEGAVPKTPAPTEIAVPDAIRGRAGTLTLIPLTPADQTSPPYRFSAVVPAGVDSFRNTAGTDFALPKDNRTPHGLVLDALMRPKLGYVARAYQNGALVSSAGPTREDGKFVLFVPTAVTGAISIQLAPSSSSDPWFTFADVTLTTPNLDLGTVTLPAYQAPEPDKVSPVVFTVQAEDSSAAPVAGALLRAVTMMTSVSDSPGVTRFWRESMTDASGVASPYLVPGANRVARMYEVSVVPPAGSQYASTCTQVPVLNGGDTATIRVPRRPVLSGTVASSAGTKLAGITVVASRAPAAVCSASPPTTFTATTDTLGAFWLPVDAGSYQLDYDAPAGSAVPRLTEFDVMVDRDIVHAVQLPRPGLIEGTVVDAAGVPVSSATVRIFAPRCAAAAGCTMAPLLRAETFTDTNGRFRAIVAH